MSFRTYARTAAALGTVLLVAGPLAAGAQAAPKAPRKPPPPTIVAKPAAVTNVTAATFEFTHATAGVTYSCSLDASAYTDCASPKTYAGPLANGAHTFRVRARDAAGVQSNAAQTTWSIDTVAPGAPALSGVPTPSPTGATTATLSFTHAEAGVTYACSLDGATAAACTSPVGLTGLGEGSHTFTVAAVDAAGNTGSPAVGSWTVDTTPPPAPQITTGPADVTNATTAAFQVFNPDTAATLTCSLDGAAYAACPEPLAYAALAEGPHTFDVRASDSLGNAANATQYAWTVDLTAPSPPAILTGPAAQTKDPVAEFTFNGFDAVSLLCSVDGGDFAECPAAYSTPALADGPHTLHVKGVDAATNVSGATPYAWSVDNTPPPAPTVTGPAALTKATSATFTITSSEALATFTCALDGGAVVPCESGVTYSSLANGAHTLVVASSDALGNTASTPYSWTVDAQAPTATFAAPASVTAPAVVTFNEPVSGVLASSLALRVSGTTAALASTLTCVDAASAAVSCATGAVTTATVTPAAALVPGERYTVVANPAGASTIEDAAGNAIDPQTWAFRAQTAMQQNTPAARYTWRVVSTSAAHGGSYRTEHLAGAVATYTFTGTGITWYTVKGRSQGFADVYVDGVLKQSVNNYAATAAYRVGRSISGLSGGTHHLRIVVRGAKGSASGTGTSVAIDAVKVNGTLKASPSFGQAWRNSEIALASGGTHAVADLAGQEVSMRFRGTAISWYTSVGRNRGIAKVYVDGVLKATVDNYASATKFNVRRTVSGLSDARHTIRIVVTGKHRAAATGNYVTVDRWSIT